MASAPVDEAAVGAKDEAPTIITSSADGDHGQDQPSAPNTGSSQGDSPSSSQAQAQTEPTESHAAQTEQRDVGAANNGGQQPSSSTTSAGGEGGDQSQTSHILGDRLDAAEEQQQVTADDIIDSLRAAGTAGGMCDVQIGLVPPLSPMCAYGPQQSVRCANVPGGFRISSTLSGLQA